MLMEMTGGLQTLYVYWQGLAFEVRPDGTRRYYHTDSLGSTRVVTDDAGSAVSAFSYDAYGAARQSVGEGRSFTYTGEQTDDYTKFVYLRARCLDPDTGRFLSSDDAPFFPTSSQGINRYTYAVGNPLRYSDPSGHMPVQWLRLVSRLYNANVLGTAETSLLALVLNSPGGTYTAFHEIAQLNVAKQLSARAIPSVLEHPIMGPKGRICEADVVSGNEVWEVKPSGSSAETQLRTYTAYGGLVRGQPLKPMEAIPIFSDLEMSIAFPGPGQADYSFKRRDGAGLLVAVPSVEVKREWEMREVAAALVFGTIMAATVAEDMATGGIGIADDVPSLGIALRAVQTALTVRGPLLLFSAS